MDVPEQRRLLLCLQRVFSLKLSTLQERDIDLQLDAGAAQRQCPEGST